MNNLAGGQILYHGSYIVVDKPLLEKCAPRKDFGRGFYLTTSLEQARSFARLSVRKARSNGLSLPDEMTGHVSMFRYEVDQAHPLDMLSFETADAAWLHCVVAHRKEQLFTDVSTAMARYDVISGKIANDQTNATIVAYMGGIFGVPGSDAADEMCIRLLIPERLHDQHCFRTEKALASLAFVGSESVCLK